MSVDHATADADDKLDPQAVPVVEYVGASKTPATDGIPLLCFNDEDGNAVGVRVPEDELQKMVGMLQPFLPTPVGADHE